MDSTYCNSSTPNVPLLLLADILSAETHEQNLHASKTLEGVLRKAHEVRQIPIKELVCDRGYRGKQKIGEVDIVLPKPAVKKDNR